MNKRLKVEKEMEAVGSGIDETGAVVQTEEKGKGECMEAVIGGTKGEGQRGS